MPPPKNIDRQPLGELSTRSLSDQVSAAIRASLLEGRYQPGERLSASGIARDLGISHIPVREALTRLEAEGHVVLLKDRGFAVPELSADTFEEVAHWRALLEEEAYRRLVPVVSDSVIDAAVRHYDEMQAALDAQDRETFLKGNREFHFCIFRLQGSAQLVRILEPLWDVTSFYQSVLKTFPVSMETSQDHHRQLLEAYRNGDAEKAVAVADLHRRGAVELVRQSLLSAPRLLSGSFRKRAGPLPEQT